MRSCASNVNMRIVAGVSYICNFDTDLNLTFKCRIDKYNMKTIFNRSILGHPGPRGTFLSAFHNLYISVSCRPTKISERFKG